MSLKQVMDEKDPKTRMLQMCGYLSVMDNSQIMPSREIEQCVDALSGHKESTELRAELESSINRCSAESGSDTPDFVLAAYLLKCLSAFDTAVLAREGYYGRERKSSPNA